VPDIQVTVNNRSYTLSCDPGQEQHLLDLVREVDRRVGGLANSIGQIGEGRLLLMVGLLLADELAEARAELRRLHGSPREDRIPENDLAHAIEKLAHRLDAIAARLEAA
jgi:cell division protein ZapA